MTETVNNEIWKPVEGYENIYEVSSEGRVRSIDRIDSMGRHHPSCVCKPCYDGGKNYLHVSLYKDGRQKSVNVHRLVAKAFLPTVAGLNEVNHKDEDKTNNRASNLEWCDHKYNNNYGSKNGCTAGIKNPQSKFSDELVEWVRNHHKRNGGEMTTSELARMSGISASHISSIVGGKKR